MVQVEALMVALMLIAAVLRGLSSMLGGCSPG